MARAVIGALTASTMLTLLVVRSVYVTIAGALERRRSRCEIGVGTSGKEVPGQ